MNVVIPAPVNYGVYQPTRTVNCIYVQGIRYCESQPATPGEMKAIGFLILYVVFVMWLFWYGLFKEKNWALRASVFLTAAPFVLLALSLIF